MPDFYAENALVLSSRPLGDRKFIVSLFTKDRGRHLGVVKKKSPPMTGSFLTVRWQARLAEQLGVYYIEDEKSANLAFLEDSKRLNALSSICFLIDALLPEREAYPYFYEETIDFLSHLEDFDFQKRYIFWEASLLEALGFGLDLTKCAGGGDSTDLAYVSPKSGRSVSRQVGLPYKDKLLPLPAFFVKQVEVDEFMLLQGLNLTAYFLLRYAGLKELPVLRSAIV
ncbi:MAG: DNA repair protein RecO [Alphaproteobacteria bacterium]|nr:DNA repair protein RecO [Alphaproteobacteria bacterium]